MLLKSSRIGITASSSVTHNSLSGLLGSTSYYHLSSGVYATLTTGLSSSFDHQNLTGILGSTSYYHISSGVYSALTSGLSTGYSLLDGSNQPFTGNIEISKVDPELRLTDTGNSEYSRLTRADANNQMVLYNRIDQPGALTDDIVLL